MTVPKLPPRAWLAIGALAAAFLLYGAGRRAGYAAAEGARAELEARAWLAGQRQAHALALKLHQVQVAQQAQARAARQRQDSLAAIARTETARADSFAAARRGALPDSAVPDSLTVLPGWAQAFAQRLLGETAALRVANGALWGSLGAASTVQAHLELALLAADRRAGLAEQRSADAATRIRELLDVTTCRIPIVGWRCPSRTVTFLAGATVIEGLHLITSGSP